MLNFDAILRQNDFIIPTYELGCKYHRFGIYVTEAFKSRATTDSEVSAVSSGLINLNGMMKKKRFGRHICGPNNQTGPKTYPNEFLYIFDLVKQND